MRGHVNRLERFASTGLRRAKGQAAVTSRRASARWSRSALSFPRTRRHALWVGGNGGSEQTVAGIQSLRKAGYIHRRTACLSSSFLRHAIHPLEDVQMQPR
eukprot:6179237-Pleurochrysis_carterae.AAC.3